MSNTEYHAGRSLGIAHAYFAHHGYDIMFPASDGCPADMVISNRENHGHRIYQTVQVKTAYRDKGRWIANTCRTTDKGREPYLPGEVDFFFIEIPGEGMVFLSYKDLRGRTRINPMSPEFKPWFTKRWF